jgi:hypothetical protein
MGGGLQSIRKALDQINAMVSEPKGLKTILLQKVQEQDLTDEDTLEQEQNLAQMLAEGQPPRAASAAAQNAVMLQRRMKARQDEKLKVEMQRRLTVKTAALNELLRIALAEDIVFDPSAEPGSPLPSSGNASPVNAIRRRDASPVISRTGSASSSRSRDTQTRSSLKNVTVRLLAAEKYTQSLISIVSKDTVELQVFLMISFRVSYVQACMHACIRTYMHTSTCVNFHVHMHVLCVCMNVCMCACVCDYYYLYV